jgi:hypothetical protein
MEDRRAFQHEGCCFQALVVTDGEAEQFNTAVFRYLELNSNLNDERTAFIVSEPEPGFRRQTATFWSAEAARDFGDFWRRLRAETGLGRHTRRSAG